MVLTSYKTSSRFDQGLKTSSMSVTIKLAVINDDPDVLDLGTGSNFWNTQWPKKHKIIESSSSSSDDEEANLSKRNRKLTKFEAAKRAQKEEERLRSLESARLNPTKAPESSLDYEELLQFSPNSSAVWIQYISFQLENAEYEKAKAIAQRALKTINTSEESERFNLWVVILRLELSYGTNNSLESSFKEALVTNDPFDVYSAMALIYDEANKIQEAEETYRKMVRKFSQQMNAWIKAAVFHYKHNRLVEARSLFDRALHTLPKKEHEETIRRFAQLEFKLGEAERGKTLYEQLLAAYPKHLSNWFVYIDLTVKQNDIQGARKLYDRLSDLNLKMMKMKPIFKKWMEFEKKHGSQSSQDSVRRRVEDYLSSQMVL